ncbi:Retrovirus-related Pol polyprotein from transposon TNT 1-94 [Nymphaea thermarum]|nr:Retrovirus-related Pol polyprotein from transposon TNT 1-94 [Nymphaea thermarum]
MVVFIEPKEDVKIGLFVAIVEESDTLKKTNVSQRNNTRDVKPTPFDGVGGLGCEGLDTKGSAPAFTLEEYHKLLSLVKNQQTNINFAGNVVHGGNICSINTQSCTWIIDSGASRHICADENMLQNLKSCNVPVTLPNGKIIPVHQAGKLSLPLFEANDVLCIPSFKVNLLSVSELTKNLNCSITFLPDHCIIQDLESKMTIGQGEVKGGLYVLQQRPPFVQACLAVSIHELWHKRLGHVFHSRLKLVNNYLDLNFDLNDDYVCDACHRAKQTRLKFGLSEISTTHPFDLIHCDIWGPYAQSTISGAHYFLSIVDDYSRVTWIFFNET